MKTFTPAAKAAIERGDAIVGGAVAILCDPPVYLWNGEGVIQIDGDDFLGIGHRALAQVSGTTIGGGAQGLTLSLSGVDPNVIPLVDADELRDAPVVVWRLIFDASGTQLLDAQVFERGRVDAAPTEEQIGGEAVISITVEGAARGLGRRGARMRADADQRLIDASDGGLSRVSYVGVKQLYWGGQRPAVASVALPLTTPAAYKMGVAE